MGATVPTIRVSVEIANRSDGCAERFPVVHSTTVLLYAIPSVLEEFRCVPVQL